MAFERVYTKARKGFEPTATEYEVDVDRNKRITIRCTKKRINPETRQYEDHEFINTFNLGDEAEYDSFNLKYTGEITSITPKTVSIRNMYGRTTRLSMNEFCFRNYDFDAVKVAEENSETMMYI